MGYEISLNLAWDELETLNEPSRCIISLLAESYEVKVGERAVLLESSGAPAEQMEAVLILHYLIGFLKHGFCPTGKWISFKETEGGKIFWPAFRKSTIKPLIECLERDPDGMARNLVLHFGGRIVEGGDVAVEVPTFPEVFVRIVYWKGDDDLPSEATMLFDQGLMDVYSMEDVAVLMTLIVQRLEMRTPDLA
jgi:hypothetical protein